LSVLLDGARYTLTLSWSERQGRWHIDVATAAGLGLLAGRKVCAGVNLLAGAVDQLAPPGMLLCMDTGPDAADPGLRDLGWTGPKPPRCLIVYLEESECA
jgi:hypothetical protein